MVDDNTFELFVIIPVRIEECCASGCSYLHMSTVDKNSWWMVDGGWWMVDGGWWMVDVLFRLHFRLHVVSHFVLFYK